MANSQAICTSFKVELMTATHDLTTSTGDTIKAALYLASGSQGAGTTAYSSTNEVSGTNYTAGGVTVTNGTSPTSSGTTAYWTPSAALTWTTVTLSTAFDCVTFYNSSKSNKALCVNTFGSTTITAGNLTINMPTNDSTNALIRLA